MIVVVSKVLVRRGLEIELPGAPLSINPLRLAEGLDVGEMGFAEDTGRLFIGHTPRLSDPHYNRAVRPYQNLEVLTEFSPRVRELIGEAARDQTLQDFFAPVLVGTDNSFQLTTTGDTLWPTQFVGDAVSVQVEYHALAHEGEDAGKPLQQGMLRILATTTSQVVTDDESVGSGLTFGVNPPTTGKPYYELTCINSTGAPVDLYLRRTVITGLSADITT